MRILLFAAVWSASFIFSPQASFAWDPVGIVRGAGEIRSAAQILSNSLERSLSQIREVLDETDERTQAYLDKIETITQDAIAAVGEQNIALIKQLSDEAQALENQIYTDLADLIFAAECAGNRVLLDTLQQSIAASVNAVRQANPRVQILGITVARGAIEPVNVSDPDQAYRSIKKIRLAKLFDEGAVATETDSYIYVSTYANLARLARQARCHYVDSPQFANLFSEEIREMNRLQNPWFNLGVRL